MITLNYVIWYIRERQTTETLVLNFIHGQWDGSSYHFAVHRRKSRKSQIWILLVLVENVFPLILNNVVSIPEEIDTITFSLSIDADQEGTDRKDHFHRFHFKIAIIVRDISRKINQILSDIIIFYLIWFDYYWLFFFTKTFWFIFEVDSFQVVVDTFPI